MDIDHRRIRIHQITGRQRFLHHQSGSDDGNLAALAQRYAFAQLKMIVLIVDIFHVKASQTYIAGTIHLCDGRNGLHRLCRITRLYDRHARNRTHQCDILIALMCGAVLPYRDSRVSRPNLHIEMRISDRISHLLERPPRREHRERTRKRHFA